MVILEVLHKTVLVILDKIHSMITNYQCLMSCAGRLGLFLFLSGLSARAQNTQLILGPPSANAQTLSLIASLSTSSASTPISGLQFSVRYSTVEFSGVTVVAASQSLSAGKSAYCAASDGIVTCILAGLNVNQIGSGAVVTCTFAKTAAFKNASSVQLTSALGVTADGTGVAVDEVTKLGKGTLTGSVGGPLVSWNLTKEGTLDWIHWADSVRKAAVKPLISVVENLIVGLQLPYSVDTRSLSWIDGGSVKTNVGSRDGIVNYGIGSGFRFSAPADQSVRTLIVHVSGYYSSGKLTAQLSDNSATDFVDYTQYGDRLYDHDYVLRYSAATSGQSLEVTWVTASGVGGVGVSAAALF